MHGTLVRVGLMGLPRLTIPDSHWPELGHIPNLNQLLCQFLFILTGQCNQ